jgi:tetratricopeptide (TPR) repeat protein
MGDQASTVRLLNETALLLYTKAQMKDAEPLMRRALAIDEASLGPNHPTVATDLNNLASLLQATNRLREAEAPMRRALAIDEASFGPNHPTVATDLNNLAQLLQATNRLQEAEPLMRRMVVIFIDFTGNTGHEHPHQRAAINNYRSLLLEMGKTREEAQAAIDKLLAAGGLA